MKYTELEELLKKSGCYATYKDQRGHPLWYSPLTKTWFQMSHHKSEEVPKGTLNKILKAAGLK